MYVPVVKNRKADRRGVGTVSRTEKRRQVGMIEIKHKLWQPRFVLRLFP